MKNLETTGSVGINGCVEQEPFLVFADGSPNVYKYDSIKVPKQQSELIWQDGEIVFVFTKKMPNIWWRFWYYVLLGWKWRKI